MATNNAPKHDFAPAWLKIPNTDNTKPPGNKQGEAGADDRISHSYYMEDKGPNDYNRLYRHHSLEQSSDGSKRFPPSNNKFRHHSVDDDYYAYNYGHYGYYNGYGYPDKYGMHYSSQPSLLRSGAQRDSKYQHPHARYGAGQGMNVGYPPYYEFLPPYDYYGNDPYYNYPPGRGNAKRNYYEKDGRSSSKEGRDKDEKKDKDSEKKPFNEDFPSLNGDEKSTSKSGQVNGTGVWENPPLGKNGNKPGDDSNDTSQSKVLRDTNIYNKLVPAKTSRRPTRPNGSLSRDTGPIMTLKPISTTSSCNSSPGSIKELTQPSTPPVEIHNTRFVTQPKTLSDKKSHFLKTLRQEDEKKGVHRTGETEELLNGVDSIDIHDNGGLLSSSLEAEQRLLREMGWNEADEEDYEITEDDMKAFEDLTKQVQQQNCPRNGIAKTIPKIWSPKHIPVYTPNPQELNDTLSSSDSDSDDADN